MPSIVGSFGMGPPDLLLNTLYANVGHPLHLPIVLSGSVLTTMRTQFEENHGSVVTFVKQLQAALAHHFTTKGT